MAGGDQLCDRQLPSLSRLRIVRVRRSTSNSPPPPGEEPAKKLGLKIRGDLAGGKMAPNVANVQARNTTVKP